MENAIDLAYVNENINKIITELNDLVELLKVLKQLDANDLTELTAMLKSRAFSDPEYHRLTNLGVN